MKRLLNKLLATILTVSMLLSPVAALADVDEAISINGVDAAVSTVEEELAPEAKSEPAPVVEEATPAGEGDAAPEGEGDAAPADDGDAAPADDGDAAPAGEGDAASDGEGDAASDGEGDAAPADDGDAAPEGEGGEGASQENVEESVEDGIVIGAVDSFVGEAESSDLPEDTLYSEEESGLSAETASGDVLYEGENGGGQGQYTITYYNSGVNNFFFGDNNGQTVNTANAGEILGFSYSTSFGYELTKVTVTSADDESYEVTLTPDQHIFTMPARNITVTPEFTYNVYTGAYTIEVQGGPQGGGSAYVDNVAAASADAGETVTLRYNPSQGYTITSVILTYGGEPHDVGLITTFEMPAANVTVSFAFSESGNGSGSGGGGDEGQYYNIGINDCENGSISVTCMGNPVISAKAGQYITIVAEPNVNYTCSDVTVDFGDHQEHPNAFYGGFMMPAKDVTISATFTSIAGSHQIQILDNANGTVTARKYGNCVTSADAGDYIWIEFQPNGEYRPGSVTVACNDGQNVDMDDGNGFYMPDSDVTVTATFISLVGQYGIATSCEHGTIEATIQGYSVTSANGGDFIDLTFSPEDGYHLNADLVSATDANGQKVEVESRNGRYSFAMPGSAVTVSATFIKGAHTITAVPGDYGLAICSINGVDVTSADTGERVYIRLGLKTQPWLYRARSYTVMCGDTKQTVTTEGGKSYFTMPDGDVTVTADIISTTVGHLIDIKRYGYAMVGAYVSGYNYEFDVKPHATAGETVEIRFCDADEGDRVNTFSLTTSTGTNVDFNRDREYNEDYFTFTMPDDDVIVKATAIHNNDPLTYYNIGIDGNNTHGSVSADIYGQEVDSAEEGATVHLNVTPGEGYKLDSLSVKQGATTVTLNEDNEFTMPAGDVTVTASFVEDSQGGNETTYTVTFLDADGRVLKAATSYAAGTPAASIEKPADPTKAATAQYTYAFAGWNPAIADVTADATYTATYTETVNKYNITFVDEDGTTVLKAATAYDYGTPAGSIVAPTETPTKDATAQYTYAFAGWNPAIADVTANATYTATYTETVNKYNITFVDDDGTVLKAATAYDYGTPAGSIVAPTETPTKAATAQYTYTFAGWSPAIADVTENATYTATYNRTVNKYTVTFVDDDGTVLKEATQYDYGTAAADIVKPADPSKAPDAQYTYTFAGWSPAIADVTADATYAATYTASPNSTGGTNYYIQDSVPPNETVSSDGYMIMAFVGGQRVTYATPNTALEIRVTKGEQCNITGIKAYSCTSPEGNPAEVGEEVTLTPTGEWTYTLNMPAGILRFSPIFGGNPDSGSGGGGDEGQYYVYARETKDENGVVVEKITAYTGEGENKQVIQNDPPTPVVPGTSVTVVVEVPGYELNNLRAYIPQMPPEGYQGPPYGTDVPLTPVVGETYTYTFTMPNGNVEFNINKTKMGPVGQYAITFAPTEHGEVHAMLNGGEYAYINSANANDSIYIITQPEQGYMPTKITVTDGAGNVINSPYNMYSFTMPAGPVTVTVNYIESHAIAVTEENFPDENLRNYLRMSAHTIGSDSTLYVESGNIKYVELNGVKNFKGLELLTALETIHIDNYSGESLTLANGTVNSIMFTNCESLKSIDLSGCTNLKEVNFEWNMPVVESLNVSGCTKLTRLLSRGAALKTLDVSKNTELTYLDCNNNQLQSLDLSKNSKLEFLACYGNNLTALDLSGCPEISRYVTEANRVSETTEEGDKFIGYINPDKPDWDKYVLLCDDGVQISLTPTFAITTVVDETQGSVDVPEKAAKDETVTVTLLPVDGFAAKGVAVTAEDNSAVEVNGSDGVYTFIMPGKPVTVTATFVPVPTVTAPTANALTYNGQNQALVTEGSTDKGALEYSLDGTNWAATVPNRKNAGEYSVYYRVPAGDDHAAFIAEEPVAVTIAQKKAKVTFSKEKTYGEQDTSVTDYRLDGLVADDSLGNITFVREKGENVKRYAYALDTVENSNYDVTVEGTLTIMPKTATLSWSGYDDLTYNGKAQLPTATVTNLKAGDECNVIVVADENDNATDAGNHTAVAVSLSNANYKLPAAANCAHPYTIAQASHENVANALTISVSANGVQDGKADLSACIPEGAMWSVKACDGTFITAASAPAESSKDRTLTYTAAKAGADVTGGSVTIEISTTNYATYTATVTFATSDVFTLNYDSKGGDPIESVRLHEGVAYGELPVLARKFYRFDGWVDNAGKPVTPETTMGAGDTTIYAAWTANKYTVALDVNGHGSDQLPAEEYPEGIKTFTAETAAFDLPKLADVTDQSTLYTFSGWTLAGDSTAYTDVTIDPAVALEALADGQTTITYKASWTEGKMVGAVSYTAPEDSLSGILGIKDMGDDGKVSTDYKQDTDADKTTSLADALKQIAADESSKIDQEATSKEVTVDMAVSATGIKEEEKNGILVQVEDPEVEGVDVKTDFVKIDVTQTTSYTSEQGGAVNNTEPLSELPRVVEIPLNYDMTGRYNLRLFRRHDGETQELTKLDSRPNSSKDMKDGRFFVSGYGRTAVIYIYSDKFSVFAAQTDNKESFEIQFESNGGTKVDVQKVYQNEKVTKPANPTKAATATVTYSFDAWCTDPELKEEYDFDAPVTKAFTLYARWTEKAIEKKVEAPSTPSVTTPAVVAPPAEPAITIPKVPASFKAKAQKKGKVALSWKKIKKTKKTKAILKQIKGVEIQYSTDITFATDTVTKTLGKNKVKATLKLQKNTVYYVRARYIDGAGGVSNWSKVRKVKTKKK